MVNKALVFVLIISTIRRIYENAKLKKKLFKNIPIWTSSRRLGVLNHNITMIIFSLTQLTLYLKLIVVFMLMPSRYIHPFATKRNLLKIPFWAEKTSSIYQINIQNADGQWWESDSIQKYSLCRHQRESLSREGKTTDAFGSTMISW